MKNSNHIKNIKSFPITRGSNIFSIRSDTFWLKDFVKTKGTLFSAVYLEKDIQDIQDIRKNIQYQEIGSIFTSPDTQSQKLDVYQKSSS